MKAFGQSVQNVGQSIAQVGIGAAIPFALSAKRFADFDDAMRATKGTTRATEAEFESMTNLARKLGRETSFTATEVANLMLNLGRAGFNPSQIEGMTAAVMDMARATGTDAALAAKIMGTSLRQFGLEAKDAARVADTLTAAANNSNNTVETLAEALSYAGPNAKKFGYSIEETAAIVGTLANAGIEASSAGTALRRLLIITGAESDKLKTIFKVDFKDINGNARNLVDVLGEITKSTAHLGTAARAEKFNEAFGLLGITGAGVIGESVADTKKLYETIRSLGGIARQTAKEMDAGLGGSIRITLSAVDDAAIAIGKALSPALMLLGAGIIEVSNALSEWVAENQVVIAVVGATIVGITALGAALVVTGAAIKLGAFALATFVSLMGAVKLPITLLMGTVAAFQAMNASLIAVGVALKAVGVAFAGTAIFARLYGASVLAAQAVTSLFRAAALATAATIKGIGAIFAASAVAVRVYGAATLGTAAAVKILRAAFLGFAAIGSVAAAAAAGVGAAMGLLGAGISALLSPIALLVGAVGGIGYAFLGASKEGQRAKAALGQTFNGIREAGVSAWEGITAAVASGDMALAAKIAGKGLEVVWLSAIGGMKSVWVEFTGFLEISFLKVGGSIATVWANILAGFKSMYNEIRTGMENIFDLPTLTKIRDLKDKIGTDKRRLQDRVDANPQKDENLLGQEERDKRAFIRARIQDAQKELDAIQGNRDKEQEQRRVQIGQELIGKEQGVADRLAGQKKDVEDRNKGRVADAMAGADAAKAELAKLVEDAKKKRDDKAAEVAKAAGGVEKKAEAAGIAPGVVGKQGTFSAAAAMVSFNGTSGVATQQLNVMKQLLEEQRKNNAINNKQLQALKDAGIILE